MSGERTIRCIRTFLAPTAVAIVALAGAGMLLATMAATPFLSAEPEFGAATDATVVADTTASGGKAVRFVAAPPATGCVGAANDPGGKDPWGGCWPGPSTTGPKGTLAVQNSGMTITTSGTIIENMEIRGQVTVQADNVTIRNVRIVSNGFWVLYNKGRNLVIEDTELAGSVETQASLAGANWTGRRLNIYGAGDGIKADGNNSLTDSYIHDLSDLEGAHNDGLELTNALNTSIVHNTILNDHGQTSALMISEYGAAADSNVLVKNNLLGGGGFTIYGGAPDTARGHEVVGNRFTTRYFARSGSYGPLAYWSSLGNTWTDNLWIDGASAGQAIAP